MPIIDIPKIKQFLTSRFDVHMDKANEHETIDSIKRGIEFKGTNSWVLVFAIFIASLGLNMNSTAVIIGAMLISPLMGPIMGIGLAMGINDFELLKRSFRNFLVTTVISLVASSIYFLISPLSEARSELLARTTPTLYDVFIALFGGLAGIVAASSKEKGNVIPGVAIATALMPPLCTAGYGLATANWAYFLGAFYLYFINAVFISWATFLGARFFRFSKKEFIDPVREKKVTRYIWLVVIATMIPSVYFAYNLFKDNIFNNNANRFVNEQLSFPNTQIIKKEIVNSRNEKYIDIILFGDEIPQASLDIARSKMPQYGLSEDVMLLIRQSAKGETADVNAIKSAVLEDFYKRSEDRIKEQEKKILSLQSNLSNYTALDSLTLEIAPELKVIFPEITDVSLALSTSTNISKMTKNQQLLAVIKYKASPAKEERTKLEEWLKARTRAKTIHLVIEL